MKKDKFSQLSLDFGRIGWKSYNLISKKAMEQEFSWTGLSISLSIAFFIVIASAQALSMIYFSWESEVARAENNSRAQEEARSGGPQKNLYNLYYEDKLKDFLTIKSASAAMEEKRGEPARMDYFLDLQWNSAVSHSVKIKNIGNVSWKKGAVFLETGPYLKSASIFRHESWLKYYRVAALEKDIAPGETAQFSFILSGPASTEGLAQQNIQLVENERVISGSPIRLFVNILKPLNTANAIDNNSQNSKPDFCAASVGGNPSEYANCKTSVKEEENDGVGEDVNMLKQEPIIRVGLYSTKYAQRVSYNALYDVYAGKMPIFSGLAAGQITTIGFDFNAKKYSVTSGGVVYFSDNFIRLVPRGKDGIATLLDFEKIAKWNTNINDNQFRNIIEFHYSEKTGNFWAINELPVENYLSGLGETTNYSPVEFQKVMVAAARTYAMYHYGRGIENNIADGSTKHAGEHFHVDAAFDQVYLGYGSEKRMSKLVQAINETRGIIISYDNKVVVTPYFSRSDGRTRDWTEVWGGQAKPWLKSVAAIEDRGETLWGHGVGMSARAALIMTRDKNISWQNTLKYFYSGVELKKIYR